MLLKTETRDFIINQIKDNKSLNNISRETGIAKSTLYYYYKKIKGRKYKEDPKFKIEFSEIEGEIVGIFVGDGSQYCDKTVGCYRTHIHFGDNLEYVNHVKKLYENYFNREWSLYKLTTEKNKFKYKLNAHNKKIFFYFQNYLEYDPKEKHCTVKLKLSKMVSRNFKVGLIRGLFDTDGTICYDKLGKRIRIQFYTTSHRLVNQIRYSLENDFNFKCNIYKRKGFSIYIENKEYPRKECFTLYLWKESVDSFLKEIKPFKGRIVGQ